MGHAAKKVQMGHYAIATTQSIGNASGRDISGAKGKDSASSRSRLGGTNISSSAGANSFAKSSHFRTQ